jgi:hypothetical protein
MADSFEWTEGQLKLARMFARSFPGKDWLCQAEGRKDHYRVLFRHPVTGLRLLKCPHCQSEEIRAWLAAAPDYDRFELTEEDQQMLREMGIRADG